MSTNVLLNTSFVIAALININWVLAFFDMPYIEINDAFEIGLYTVNFLVMVFCKSVKHESTEKELEDHLVD